MEKSSTTAIDPVCNMSVDPQSARSSTYQGTAHFFCSESCLKKFEASPDAVLAKAAQREEQKTESGGNRSCCSGPGAAKGAVEQPADAAPTDSDAMASKAQV